MNDDGDLPRLYRLREAAKMIGMDYHVLLSSAKRGDLTAIRIGNGFRVTLRALRQFVTDLERGDKTLRTR